MRHGTGAIDLDANYPYPGGLTGAYGYDLQADVIKSPLLADIMGYCANPWISDYTYEGMLAFRTADQSRDRRGRRGDAAALPARVGTDR